MIRHHHLFLVLLLAPFTTAFAGNEGGHGGDPYALEFTTIADQLGQKLIAAESKDPTLFQKWHFRAVDFRKTALNVRVVSVEGGEMTLNGQEVDAINFPSQYMIKVNRTRWREDDLTARARLALHEIFGILGVERDVFNASLDFSDFVTQASKEISAEHPGGSFMASLFYGRCLSFPNLTDADTCDSASDKLAKAEACAVTQAEGKCKISGKRSCALMNTSYTPVLSTTQLGLRYCEVLVIMK